MSTGFHKYIKWHQLSYGLITFLTVQDDWHLNRRGKSNLWDAEPIVSKLHGFCGILHWFHWIPCLPVWAQAYKGHTEQPCQPHQLIDTQTPFLHFHSWLRQRKKKKYIMNNNNRKGQYLARSCRPELPVPSHSSNPGWNWWLEDQELCVGSSLADAA